MKSFLVFVALFVASLSAHCQSNRLAAFNKNECLLCILEKTY